MILNQYRTKNIVNGNDKWEFLLHQTRYALAKIFFTTIIPIPAAATEKTLLAATYDNALAVFPSDIHVTTSKENVLKVVKLRKSITERKQSDNFHTLQIIFSHALCHAAYLPQNLFGKHENREIWAYRISNWWRETERVRGELWWKVYPNENIDTRPTKIHITKHRTQHPTSTLPWVKVLEIVPMVWLLYPTEVDWPYWRQRWASHISHRAKSYQICSAQQYAGKDE